MAEKDTATFTITVNSNYDPIINNIANYSINENDSADISLSASDRNAGDTLSFSLPMRLQAHI